MSGGARPSRSAGAVSRQMVIVGGLALAAVLIVTALLLPGRTPDEPIPPPVDATAQPDAPALETVAPAQTEEQRGDSAREIVAALRADAGDGAVDYAQGYERARRFLADGRLADAQLLLFFAARGGHAPAAFDLATLYDPNHFSEETALMDAPDAYQAFRWYGEARQAGDGGAAERLAELRRWVERAAQQGDPEAQRLLVQWEEDGAM